MGDTECVCVPKEKYYFCFPHSPSAILKYFFKGIWPRLEIKTKYQHLFSTFQLCYSINLKSSVTDGHSRVFGSLE